jgi:hypothetical protein
MTVTQGNRDEVITVMAPAIARGGRGHYDLGGYLHASYPEQFSDLFRMEPRFVGRLYFLGDDTLVPAGTLYLGEELGAGSRTQLRDIAGLVRPSRP